MKNCIRDLYQDVIGAVCRETGIAEYEILNSNRECCVDARYILVHILSQKLTDDEIASVTGLSRTCANKIRNSFPTKMGKFSVKASLSEVCHELSTHYPHT